MQEAFSASPIAYSAGSSLACLIALILSFILKHIFRNRLTGAKYLGGVIVAGHLLAYTLFLINPHSSGSIEDKTITAGLIVLALIPSFILATAIGRKNIKAESRARPSVKGDDETDKATGDETPEPAEADQMPGFGEGLIRGIWAFVAIWIFYTVYMMIFYISIVSFDEAWKQ